MVTGLDKYNLERRMKNAGGDIQTIDTSLRKEEIQKEIYIPKNEPSREEMKLTYL